MTTTPEWTTGRVPLLDEQTGRFPDSFAPPAIGAALEEMTAAVAHVDAALGQTLARSANLADVPSPDAARAHLGAAAAVHHHAVDDVTGLTATLATKADLVGGVVPTSQIPARALVNAVPAAAQAATDAGTSATAAAGVLADAVRARDAATAAADDAAAARDATEQTVTTGLAWAGDVDLTALAAGPVMLHATLTGNTVLRLPALSPDRACTVSLLLTQDAVGGRTLTVPGAVAPHGLAPAPSAAGGVDLVHLLWTGTGWLVIHGAPALATPAGWA